MSRQFGMSVFALLALTSAVFAEDRLPVREAFHELLSPSIDPARIGEISDVTLVREAAELYFESGTLHFFRPTEIGGELRTTGCVFIGTGKFRYSPPVQGERNQLRLFTGAETIDSELDVVYLRFGDATYEELQPLVTWTGKKRGKPEYKVDYGNKFFTTELVASLLHSATHNPDLGFFYAQISFDSNLLDSSARDSKPHFFLVDPLQDEEIQLFLRRPGDTGYHRELVNMMHRAAEYEASERPDNDSHDLIRTTHHQIGSHIGNGGSFAAVDDVTFEVIQDGLTMVPFYLSGRLDVRSVAYPGSTRLDFHRPEDSNEVYVFFDSPLQAGSVATARFRYDGDILGRTEGGYYISSSIGWYPSYMPPTYGSRNRTTFDLAFRYPKRYQLLSIGDKIDERTDGGNVISRWRTAEPTPYASFNLGEFEVYEEPAPVDTLPTIAVYMCEGQRRSVREAYAWAGIPIQKNVEARIAADIANATRFFTYLFGRCPSDTIAVTEIPFGHGQSFPGLLHLSWSSFMSGIEELQLIPVPGTEKAFRAHETAHQWWGNAVNPKTYHDAWLSEGFAEYSGYWYVQLATKRNDEFFGLLQEARTRILRESRNREEDGSEPPIWMGTRASSSRNSTAYQRLIYSKGAWVLHMLRCLLVDLKTLDESVFIHLMHDFFSRYKGGMASTEDFRRVVEEHVGIDMRWFFDQWIYGTVIPTYEFGSGWRKTGNGMYRIQSSARQKNVPDDFQAYVIVRVEFEDGQYYQFRVLMDEPMEEFPPVDVPMEPIRVVFNDLGSVLAEDVQLLEE